MSVLGKLEISELTESTIEWKIENFSKIDAAVGVKYCSPVFITTCDTRKISWQLEFYPGGRDQEGEEYMGLFLCNLSKWDVTVCYKLSILDENRDTIKSFAKTRSFKSSNSWGKPNFISKIIISGERTKVITNDTLLIRCFIKNTLTNGEQCNEDEDEQNNVRAHFRHLLESGELSDVTFEIENKQMQLHKAVVTSLSPVFLAMFRHYTKEKAESVVRITDVKYEVMKELFRYIYVRETPNIESMVDDLLVAADKYVISGLKAICEKSICKNVNENNALQYLEFAIKYNTTFLKANVTEFIMSRLANFVDTPEFERMDGCCKDELLRKVAKNSKTK